MRTPAFFSALLCCAFAYCVSAQSPEKCVGPAGLESRIHLARPGEAYNDLGAWFGAHQKTTCAISSFEAALKADPGLWRARFNLGLALERSGNLQRAEQELRTVVEQRPDSAEALQALGDVLSAGKRYTAAITYLRKAVALDPKNVDHQLAFGEALYNNGSAAEAIQLLSRCATDNPRSALAQF